MPEHHWMAAVPGDTGQTGGADEPADHWLRWSNARPGLNREHHWLCELDAGADLDKTLAAFRADGWAVPAAYDAAQADGFFTARRAVAQGQALLPTAAGPVTSAGGNEFFHLLLERALGWKLRARLFAAPLLQFLGVPPPVFKPASVVLAVIDCGLGFLHEQFRDAQGGSRFIAYWDQGSTATATATPGSAWRCPPEFGFGRELDRKAIDAELTALAAAGPQAHERERYAALGLAAPEWSHGHQVLGLAAARVRLLDGQQDAASAMPLIAVQVPETAFENRHGQWLKTCVLDGLHYILARTPPDAAVVVTISLGAHSGAHDGGGLLERAIDALIERQAGRLCVVLAAGNSRRVNAHAALDLKPEAEDELVLSMVSDDESANFVEVWSEPLAGGAPWALTASLQPPGGLAAGTVQVDSGGPESDWQWLWREKGAVHDAGIVAMLGATRQPAGGSSSPAASCLQLTLGLAQPRSDKGPTLPPAPVGEYRLGLRNTGPGPLRLHAWIARDDGTGTGNTIERRHKSFAEPTLTRLCSPWGTLGEMAWTRRSIVVGGYRADLDGGTHDAIYEDGAAGFAPGSAEAARRRAGPDLCAPALVWRAGVEQGVGWLGFCSGRDAPLPATRWPLSCCGTSMAAPLVARRLAVLLDGGAPTARDALLAALKQAPGATIAPANEPERTGDYWLKP